MPILSTIQDILLIHLSDNLTDFVAPTKYGIFINMISFRLN